ncbi:FabD/lysophospholipase-like protein [Daldinia caldariorum]|uniref:FabD/lysophospholipase-like protein n=1 Tax=Daldinia caldariorum TaxID=326644 RepID=UPI00200807F7|nr:FabD/lysophospholipase-like protein [Daldinia caldariorum]KAI1467811.1 FabD/lysophospholipase-like protein [Daldinia caldariorum]
MTPTLKILSLDGGGIRGISSILILQEVMENIRRIQGLQETPRPCEYFDFIGGTSTGGILAIMLGRLGMTIEDCIIAYKRLAKRAFTPKRRLIHFPLTPTGAYSAKALEEATKEVVKAQCKDRACSSWDTCSHENALFRNDACVKTAVLAVTKENVDARPTLFRTYDETSGFRNCAIWEVARATSAASTFFKSIRCGRDDIEFIDAGFGYNNPCEVLIEEAQKKFPEARQMCILSIGTGLGAVATIQDSGISILRALKSISVTSKKVADRLDEKYGSTGKYYRFNVDRGLEDVTLADWDKVSKISAHTHNYLLEKQRDIIRCAEAFSSAERVTSSAGSSQGDPPLGPPIFDEPGRTSEEALDDGRLSILRNIARDNSEQRNAIIRHNFGTRAQISHNTSSGGSKQWNSIRG